MSRRRTRGRAKIQRKKLRNVIFSAAGVLALVGIIAAWLISGQIEGNSKDCEKIGLEGGLGVLGFSPCKISKDKIYQRIFFVVGNTMSSPKPEIGEEIKDYIASSMIDGNMNVINLRSVTPTRYEMRDVDTKKASGENVEKMTGRISDVFDEINSIMSTSPRANGADYYGAIEDAASDLSQDVKRGKKCLIVVIGSGLSDSGILNFAEAGLLNENKEDDVEQITEAIVGKDILKRDYSFGDIDIVWQNAGVVVAPQDTIDRNGRDAIERIYEKILGKIGFNNIEFIKERAGCASSADGRVDDGSQCERRSVNSDGFIVAPTSVNNPDIVFQKIVIDEGKIGFEGDSWEVFTNPSAANNYLNEVAESIKSANVDVVVTGYMAHEPCDDNNPGPISGKRADTIRAKLIERGVDPNKIESRNGGFGNFAQDCINGVLDENEAKKNRVIVIEQKVN